MEYTGERYVPGSSADTKETTGFEHRQRYLAVLPILYGKDVMDIACGEGYGSDIIADVAHNCLGIDINEEAIEYARRVYQRDNLSFACGDVVKVPVNDASYDAVVSFETIEHVDLPSQRCFLKEVKRTLRPEGIFIVSCPNETIATVRAQRLWGYKNPFHIKEHDIFSFKKLLEEYFEEVTLLYQRTEDAIILSEQRCSELKVQLSDKNDITTNAQNIIAVCADKKVNVAEMNSVVFDIHKNHMKMEEDLSYYIHEREKLLQKLNSEEERTRTLNAEKEVLQQKLIDLENREFVLKEKVHSAEKISERLAALQIELDIIREQHRLMKIQLCINQIKDKRQTSNQSVVKEEKTK